MFSLTAYLIGLGCNWLVGCLMAFFAGRRKEKFFSEKVPHFILLALLFGAVGLIPYANVVDLLMLPLCVAYSMAYSLGYFSKNIKVNLTKAE